MIKENGAIMKVRTAWCDTNISRVKTISHTEAGWVGGRLINTLLLLYIYTTLIHIFISVSYTKDLCTLVW